MAVHQRMSAKKKSLANQHQGGVANKQGGAFEDNFAVWRCMEALRQLELGAEQRKLASQLKNAPVDDWVEKRSGGQHHYQLKRVKKLSWGAIAADFKKQLKTAASATLVVRSAKTMRSLSRSPKRVKKAEPAPFSGCDSPGAGHEVEARLTRAQVGLCQTQPHRSRPGIDLGGDRIRVEERTETRSFRGIDRVEKRLCDHEAPIRIRWSAPSGWNKARKLLSSFAGLSFHIDGGHFFFDDGAGSRGLVSCKSSRFVDFVRAVADGKITTTDDVGAYL